MTRPRPARRAIALAFLACAMASRCAPSTANTRPVRLVSRVLAVDTALASARHDALEGTPASLASAERTLRETLTRYPIDPLAPVARVLLVRVLVATDQLDQARIELSRVDASLDPDLIAQRNIAHGVLDVRDAARAQNTADHQAHLTDARRLLTPLAQTRPDTAETVELSCALAECAAIEDDPASAIRTLARTLATVERAETAGSPWVRTGLRCEDPASRARLVDEVAQRVSAPRALTDAIDDSAVGSALRRPLAERLLTLARDRNEVSRYLRWLADLPDDRATQAAPSSSLSSVSVVGLIVPLSGPRAAVGTSYLRGAQLALERVANVRIALEDEGTEPSHSGAAIDRLFAQGARAVIGPTRDDFAPTAAIRAQSVGVPLFLLAVPQAIEATGSLIRPAVPSTIDRAEALAHAALSLGRSPRALVIASTTSDPLAEAIEDALLNLGVSATHAVFDSLVVPRREGVVHVIAGDLGREPRYAIARAFSGRRLRWILDARAAVNDSVPLADDPHPTNDPRTMGPWVGVRAGPGFASVLALWCARFGESPDELALLAHDAALRAAEALRRGGQGLPQPALDPRLVLVASTIAQNAPWSDAMPAAAARCPRSADIRRAP